MLLKIIIIPLGFMMQHVRFIDTLTDFPELGTIENKEKEIRAFTIVKQINLFYRVDKKKIIILNFFDNRQSPTKKRF